MIDVLLAVVLLACPVGLGLVLWSTDRNRRAGADIARQVRRDVRAARMSVAGQVEQLTGTTTAFDGRGR